MMDLFMENPGLCHIGKKILKNLDFKNQTFCRLVRKSWKNILDKEALGIDVDRFFKEFVVNEAELEIIRKSNPEKAKELTNKIVITDEDFAFWLRFIYICINPMSEENVWVKTYIKNVIKKITKIKLKDVGKLSNSPLPEFYKIRNFKMLELVLKETETYNFCDIYEVSSHAIEFDDLEMVKLIKPFFWEYDLRSQILKAAAYGRLEILKLLYDDPRTSSVMNEVRENINGNRNVIHTAAIYGHYEIVKTFHDKVTNPMAEDTLGNTPIHYSATYGYLEIVKLLTNLTANPLSINEEGLTPLDLATKYKHGEIIEHLSSFGN